MKTGQVLTLGIVLAEIGRLAKKIDEGSGFFSTTGLEYDSPRLSNFEIQGACVWAPWTSRAVTLRRS
jgi:hypothetical protein